MAGPEGGGGGAGGAGGAEDAAKKGGAPRESRQLGRLRAALYEDFRARYQAAVAGAAYEVYVQGRPLAGALTPRQERKVRSFAERFAHAFNVVAGELLRQ